MFLASLASSSSGNAVFLKTERASVLIDAGLSGKKLSALMAQIPAAPADLQAVLLTHEHADHICGLKVLMKRFGLPVFMTEGTAKALLRQPLGRDLPDGQFRIVREDEPLSIGDLRITPVAVSHDAAQPVAYLFESGGRRAACVTDLGCFDERLTEKLRGLDAIYLEANHDPMMLQAGRYPYPLKERIAGKKGHLSNDDCGRLLGRIAGNTLHSVLLAHLSRENNYPPLALAAVRAEAIRSGFAAFDTQIRLEVAPEEGIATLDITAR